MFTRQKMILRPGYIWICLSMGGRGIRRGSNYPDKLPYRTKPNVTKYKYKCKMVCSKAHQQLSSLQLVFSAREHSRIGMTSRLESIWFRLGSGGGYIRCASDCHDKPSYHTKKFSVCKPAKELRCFEIFNREELMIH